MGTQLQAKEILYYKQARSPKKKMVLNRTRVLSQANELDGFPISLKGHDKVKQNQFQYLIEPNKSIPLKYNLS